MNPNPKTTVAQDAFDMIKHGWSFARADGLANRVTRCGTLVERSID